MKTQLAIVLLLFSACGDKQDQHPAPAEPGAGQSCPAQVTDLSEWMGKLRSEGGHQWPATGPTPGANLVVTAAATAAPTPHSALISLSADELSVEGTVISGAAVDGEKLKEFLAALKASSGANTDASMTLGLAVDRNTPWSSVVAAVAASSLAGYSHVDFLFKGIAPKPTLSPPAASSMTAEIAAARREVAKTIERTAQEQALLLPSGSGGKPDLLEKSAANCPPLQEVFKAAAGVAAGQRARHLTDSVVAAIRDCECRADLPALKEVYWYLTFARQEGAAPGKGVVLTPVSPDVTGATTIAAPAAATWQDVHTKVLDAATSGARPKVVFAAE